MIHSACRCARRDGGIDVAGEDGARPASTGSDDKPGLLASLSTRVFGQVGSPEQSAVNRGWILVTSSAIVAGVVLIALLATSPRSFAAGCLLALAAATTGSLAGFLFGLPRSTRIEATTTGAAGDPNTKTVVASAGYRANTNLEDISDWLTKILVGLGLTQLGSIPGQFKSLMDTVKVVLGTSDDASAIAGSVIVGYVILGFLATYLWARTRLSQAFRLGDQDPSARLDRVEEQISHIQTTMESKP
jgi:hypothetical protein